MSSRSNPTAQRLQKKLQQRKASKKMSKDEVDEGIRKINKSLLSSLNQEPNVKKMNNQDLLNYLNYVIGFSLAGDLLAGGQKTVEQFNYEIANVIPNTVWLLKMMKLLMKELETNPDTDTKQLKILLPFSLGTHCFLFFNACKLANFLTDEAMEKFEIKKLFDEINQLYNTFKSSGNENQKEIAEGMDILVNHHYFSDKKYATVQEVYEKFLLNLSERRVK
jgi:hypothetical protein